MFGSRSTNWTSTGSAVARRVSGFVLTNPEVKRVSGFVLTRPDLKKDLQGLNIDEPLAMLRSTATSYYEADGLGSITSLSNSSGSIVNTYSYNSFGNLTASTGSLVNPFRFTAREYDESGLYFYRARYYDQQTGRFLSEDPMRFDESNNFFPYVQNNPSTFIDPSGLVAQLYCEQISRKGHSKFEQLILLIVGPYHCYLYVSCHGSGHYLELYGPGGGDPKHGRPHSDKPFNPDRAKNSIEYPIIPPTGMKCCEFEDRLLRAYQNEASELPIYNPLGPNSNTFVSNIIRNAGGTVPSPPEQTPGWGWTPPKPRP